jgi:hypothetical protein
MGWDCGKIMSIDAPYGRCKCGHPLYFAPPPVMEWRCKGCDTPEDRCDCQQELFEKRDLD